ncbi:hypothetical protein KEM54_004389 [Ascosphaera aggregata]|nr:hypothetical protein KEM54_004389 [Ascosphaera aggregata]
MSLKYFCSAIYLLLLSITVQAGWTIQDDYTIEKFFSKFDFDTFPDPTHGTVQFLSQYDAQKADMISTNNGIYLGIEHREKVPPEHGRKALRLTSRAGYGPNSMFVADISHMPDACGTWPAFWLTAKTGWPDNGEVDIIEGANGYGTNTLALHTGKVEDVGECQVQHHNMSAREINWGSCAYDGSNASKGPNGYCNANDTRPTSFGSTFNKNGGGVSVAVWTPKSVKIWSFPRGEVPKGDQGPLGSGPDPTTWGSTTVTFEGCDFSHFLKKLHIVIDTTLCGDWAGDAWSYSGCQKKTNVETCSIFVREHPEAFKDAYWMFDSLKAFTARFSFKQNHSVCGNIFKATYICCLLGSRQATLSNRLTMAKENPVMPPLTGQQDDDDSQTISIYSNGVAITREEKLSALRLISASVAQQRATAVRAVIFHPTVLPPVVILICALGRKMLAGDKFKEIITLLAITVCAIMAVLVSVQWMTAAYLWEAQRVGTMRWLAGHDRDKATDQQQPGKEDAVFVTRFGEDIVGALVLTFITKNGFRLTPRIRAWTVDTSYRNSGIGTSLLESAIAFCKAHDIDPYTLDFAPDHANSFLALPSVFNGVFERRDRWVRKKLGRVLDAAKEDAEVIDGDGLSRRELRERRHRKKHENPLIFKGLMG